MKLIFEVASPYGLPSGTVTLRVARLYHETLGNSVENEIVIVFSLGMYSEILDCLGGELGKQLELDVPERCVYDGVFRPSQKPVLVGGRGRRLSGSWFYDNFIN